jgi:Zeta toxin
MYQAIVAAARVSGLLHDPAVLTAAKWQDWLHPRGKDGRFIEKNSFVNVFASENALLTDRTAVRRRAKIVDLRPEGAYVAYYDMTREDENGEPILLEPDDEAGFPEMIPVDQLGTKVSTAPKEIAHLQPGESAAKEVKDALEPAMSVDDYEARIGEINAEIEASDPEQIAIVSTGQAASTNAEMASHVKFIGRVEEQYVKGEGLAYGAAFKDSFGLWSEEWQQIFDAVVDELYDELTENQTKPKNSRAIVLGGLPGAGKSSTLDKMADSGAFREGEWITLNPDLFKDKMIERDLHPKIAGLAPAETASFIHEAASEMNHMLEQLLSVEGYNLIFDITLGGQVRPGQMDWNRYLIQQLETQGYAIDGVFVDVDPNTSRKRVQKRHKEGLDAYRTGRSRKPDDPQISNGGRVVPDKVIAMNVLNEGDPDAERFKSRNAANFDAMKDSFVRWAEWDNSGDEPVFVGGTASGPDDGPNMPGFYEPDTGTEEAA